MLRLKRVKCERNNEHESDPVAQADRSLVSSCEVVSSSPDEVCV